MSEDFYTDSSVGQDHDECGGYLDQLTEVSATEIEDLKLRNIEWKIRKYNEIKFARDQFHEKCLARFDTSVRRSLTSQFDFDLIKLISVMKEEVEIGGTAIEEEINRASSEEISAVEKLESFSAIDGLGPEKIREALERKHGHIYDIIRNWYNSQMEEFNRILDATPQSKMRNSIRSEIMNRYDDRFKRLTSGIIEYMKRDSTAVARLFNEYTEVVNRAYESQARWGEIISGFGYAPIHETERKYEVVEAEEGYFLESLAKLKRDMLEASDINPTVEKMKAAYAETIERHSGLKDEISAKIGQMDTIIDKGEYLVKDLRSAGQGSPDDKARAVQEAQLEYIDSRLEDMKESLSRLKDLEDHVDAHLLKYRDELEQVGDLADKGHEGKLVTLDEVRIQAIDVLSRFKKKMEESLPLKLSDPVGKGELKISTRNELYASALDENRSGSNDQVVITGTTFRFMRKRILSQSLNLNLSILYLVHRNRLNQNAVDRRPFSLSEFVDLVLYLMDNNAGESASYAILISPTGFDSRIMDYLSGDHRLFARNLFIYAMDPVTGKTFGNQPIPDPTISSIVNLQLAEERLYSYRKNINDYLDRYGEVSLERIAEEQKMPLDELRNIAEDMEDEREIVIAGKKDIHMIKRRK